jgi:lysophospholipid acyltransferase (LPLAT)-like uncharacterized protein
MSPKCEVLPRQPRRAIAASLPHLPRLLNQAKESLALIPLVGSSHKEGGLNMRLLLQALKKTENLILSTSVAHYKNVLPYY